MVPFSVEALVVYCSQYSMPLLLVLTYTSVLFYFLFFYCHTYLLSSFMLSQLYRNSHPPHNFFFKCLSCSSFVIKVSNIYYNCSTSKNVQYLIKHPLTNSIAMSSIKNIPDTLKTLQEITMLNRQETLK